MTAWLINLHLCLARGNKQPTLCRPNKLAMIFLEKTFRTGEQKITSGTPPTLFRACACIRINSSHDRLAHKLPRMPGPRKQTADFISPKQARNDFLEKTFFA